MLPNIIADIERGMTLEDVLNHYHAKEASSQQAESSRRRYFCPFGRCAGDRQPHFIIDHDRLVDGYGKRLGKGHINKDTVVMKYWRCEHTRTEGYGVVALVAAIHGFPSDRALLTRDQWVTVIRKCADIKGIPAKELADDARNGWLMVNPPRPQWSICLADDFTPEAFTALSLDGMDGVGAKTIIDLLHHELGMWQVEKYIMAGCYPDGDHSSTDLFKSYERRAHALFPIFAFCYDYDTGAVLAENPEKRTDKWVARIIMPAFVRQRGEDFDWRHDFWTVFNSDDVKEDLKEWRKSHSLFGDEVARVTYTTRRAADAVRYSRSLEEVVSTCEVKDEANSTKTDIVFKPVPLPPDEVRLGKLVLCSDPLDAVTSYLWLNYPRLRFTDPKTWECGSEYYRNDFWHVAWLAGPDKLLNIFDNNKLRVIATDTFELFGNDRSEISAANTNSLRYNYLRLCMLPTAINTMDAVDSGFGKRHIPHTPRDFFRYYAPTLDEQARNMLDVDTNVGVKALMLQKELNGSSALRPFTQVPKKKKRAGEKEYTYELNMNAAWQMMLNKGYCRSLLPNKKRDTIGQCYRIDGHFVYELDPVSVMADMRKSLEDYAKDNAHGDTEDIEMMMNAMLRCKDLQYERNITKLPLMPMPKSESYGIDLDYFFFRNGALEITSKSIRFRRYEELDFLVYQSEVLPWDFEMPFYGSRSPITIRQSAEYDRLLKEYENARREDRLSSEELWDLKQRLQDFALVGRWEILITPTDKTVDNRLVVPKKILDDEAHNEWLRWWPFLRLLRCFANEDFALEEAGKFTDTDRQVLMARMANLMFTLGRCVWRWRGVQYMPYFLENTVDREGKAQGGSGKSVLLEHFVAFVRYVCNVNGKEIRDNGDFGRYFSNYVHHKHVVVHIEDFPRMPIDPLFNYASGKFISRALFENKVEIEHEESPNIVISSNYVVQSTDESALGRVQFGGMSHYFSREVAVLNKEGRRLDTIMPDIVINGKPWQYSIEQSSQIIYVFAKCLQFCMMCTQAGVQVAVPGTSLLERISRTELGDTFYDWFTNFLDKPHVYNVPLSINEMFNDYRTYYDPSKARFDSVSRTKFYEGMQKYCAKPAHGVLFMPIKSFLSQSELSRSNRSSTRRSDDATLKSYLRKGASWFTRTFVDKDGKVHRARVLSKNAGDGSVTGGAIWLSKRGHEPKDADEMQRMIEAFMAAPDPEPVLDENDQPVTEAQYSEWTMLNTEEEAEIIRKSGGVRRPAVSAATQVAEASVPVPRQTGEAEIVQEELPF